MTDVSVSFGRGAHRVAALDGVSLHVMPGETLGLVGESGSGKSTAGRVLLGLLTPGSGSVMFRGMEISRMDAFERKVFRIRVSAVFQDPGSSLDPRMTIRRSLAEPLVINGLWEETGEERVCEMVCRVGMDPSCLDRRPHEFSGGQRQRIAIARALMLKPSLVICDEPVSALDPSVQAQIVNLLLEQGRELGLSYLFISHDLRLTRHMSDRVAVMHRGRLVETGTSGDVGGPASQPYTRELFASLQGI
jgi:peptide/nickel transport system ATP-binding protein